MNQSSQSSVHVTVCLVEDDAAILNSCTQTLVLEGFDVRGFATAHAFLDAEKPGFPFVLITDVNLPGEDGLTLMRQVLSANPQVPVVIMTGHGDIGMAVGAMREGAFDFIEKPFLPERLLTTVRNAAEKAGLLHQVAQLSSGQGKGVPALIGQSERIRTLKQQVAAMAPTGVDILINGATGCGKEVVAQTLHALSGLQGPFVAINCAALPENIVESELFGHEVGAFTGAVKRRVGKFEYAKGGTLFLDEIESMPLALQAKLLRTIQERTVQRLGSNQSIPVSCRIVAATKANLKELSDQGQFRSDLYFRLNVVSLYLPTLVEIREDIPLIFAYYLNHFRAKHGVPISEPGEGISRYLVAHDWPGNIRELKNFAERVAIGFPFADGGGAALPAQTLPQILDRAERDALTGALRLAKGHVAEAAAILGIPAKTLYDKLAKLGMAATDFKA